MPNRKTDTNNRLGFSTDFIGKHYDYPVATYAGCAASADSRRNYQKGLMRSLAYHPRMPEHIRNEVSKLGLCNDEFTGGKGWKEQLYVREACRMASSNVMTQYNCEGLKVAPDAVGLSAYGKDSHHVQRYVLAQRTSLLAQFEWNRFLWFWASRLQLLPQWQSTKIFRYKELNIKNLSRFCLNLNKG